MKNTTLECRAIYKQLTWTLKIVNVKIRKKRCKDWFGKNELKRNNNQI